MKVFMIIEENHGSIGVATSPKSAMRWLLDEGWIEGYTDYSVYTDKGWVLTPVERYCEQNGIADWQQWLMDNASIDFLEDGFLIHLREYNLAETE